MDTYKPGERCRQSGQYAIINAQGENTGVERTLSRGERFPPTPDAGQTYLLVDPTRHGNPATSEDGYNYLFVSDFHVSVGIDPDTGLYHPREDFLYDDEFSRFLHWADENREDGRLWELVFVGDCFDFLPVGLAWLDEYQTQYTELLKTLTMSDQIEARGIWNDFLNFSSIPRRLIKGVFEQFDQENFLSIERVNRDELEQSNEFDYEGDGSFSGEFDIDPCTRDLLSGDEYDEDEFYVYVYDHTQKVELPAWLVRECIKDKDRQNYVYFLTNVASNRLYRWYWWLRRNEHFIDIQYRLLTEQAMSVEKLCVIYRGHPQLFETLAWWVAQGHKLVLMQGNHDLEICWPGVQNKFKELLFYKYQSCVAKGQPAAGNKKTAFEGRIDFDHPWFYYKQGVFYAQHGTQYESHNAALNVMEPYQFPNKELLNPAFGSVGVATFVAHIEDQYPEWENEGKYSATLRRLLRDYPWRATRLIAANVWQFSALAMKLYKDTRANLAQQVPQSTHYQAYANKVNLDQDLVRNIYERWDQPPNLYRWFPGIIPLGLVIYLLRFVAIIFFVLNILLEILKWLLSPRHGLILLVAIVTVFLMQPGAFQGIVDSATRIIESRFIKVAAIFASYSFLFLLALRALIANWGDIIKRKNAEEHKVTFQFAFDHEFLRKAAGNIYWLFTKYFPKEQIRAKVPHYYIMGHDHNPNKYKLDFEGYEGTGFWYFNTGAWLSAFADTGTRRLRTGGLDLEFTFLKIWYNKKDSDDSFEAEKIDYDAQLLRWNDFAGCSEKQIVIGTLPEEEHKLLSGWVAIIATLGLVIGVITQNLGLWIALGLAAGLLFELVRKFLQKDSSKD